MSTPTHPVRATGLEIEEAGDGFIVYDSTRDRVHYLNHTAALILELSNGDLDLPGIAHWIARVYSLPSDPVEDITRVVGELATEGLLTGTESEVLDKEPGNLTQPNRSDDEEGPCHVAR